jgi:YD repeat-containing protein
VKEQKMRKRAGILICLTVFSFVLVACSNTSSPSPQQPGVATIKVTPTAVLFTEVGQSHNLTAQAYDAQGNLIEANFTWRSSNPAQVEVDQNGVITSKIDVGSAQIFVEAEGVRSLPAQILVAQPAEGAILIDDAQVVSGPELLENDELPEAVIHYRVILKGITAPAPGTILLARESASIGGRVVSSTVNGEQLNIVLELVPLDELFVRHNISFEFDLDLYDLEMVDDPFSTSTVTRNTDGSVNWHYTYDRTLDPLAEEKASRDFKRGPLKCSASVAAYLNSTVFDIKMAGKPTLYYQDSKTTGQDRYLKVNLAGELSLTASGGVKVEAGFSGKGECELVARIRIPLGGPISVFIAPVIPVGLGFGADGKFVAASGEITLQGKVGANINLGFECGPGQQSCRSIDKFEPINQFKPEVKIPSANNMRVTAGLSFHLISGLDMAVLVVKNYSLFKATLGPRQDINLALVDAQASDKAYASNYDLKLRGQVGLGSDVQKWLNKLLKDSKATVSLSLTIDSPLGTSPAGTLSVDRAQVNVDKTVRFTVDLNPASVNYLVVGYNVVEVRIYHMKDGYPNLLHTIPVSASNQTRFTWDWTATKAYLGHNEFVAFVVTNALPFIPLEIRNDSTATVEVVEICEPLTAGVSALQITYGDCGWVGTAKATYFLNGVSEVLSAQVTFKLDPEGSSSTRHAYDVTSGSVTWTISGTHAPSGCTYSAEPVTSPIPVDDPPALANGVLIIDYDMDPPSYYGGGSVFFKTAPLVTGRCPNSSATWEYIPQWAWLYMGTQYQPLDGNSHIIEGTYTDPNYSDPSRSITYEWHFERQ